MRPVRGQGWWDKGTPEEVPGYTGTLPSSYTRCGTAVPAPSTGHPAWLTW